MSCLRLGLLLCAAEVGLLIFPAAYRVHAGEGRTRYVCDFRFCEFDNASLSPFGEGAVSLIHPTEDGLLVIAPGGSESAMLGVKTKFRLQGDFEVTVSYEIEHAPLGFGTGKVGASLYVNSELGSGAEIGIFRFPERGDTYTTYARARLDSGSKRTNEKFAAKSTRGMLRLRRVDSKLFYEVREDWEKGPFRLISSAVFSADDVKFVRLSLVREGLKNPVKIVFGDVSISADALVYEPTRRPHGRSSWLGAAALLSAVGLGIWWICKRRCKA